MAARQSPQLRLFRNDFAPRRASLAVRLTRHARATATRSARASTVETDRLPRTKIVQAGSGFLSQHSKELLFGLGPSRAHPNADGRVAVGRHGRSFTGVAA